MQPLVDMLEQKINGHEKEIEDSAVILDNIKIEGRDIEQAKIMLMAKDKIMFHKGSIAALEDIIELIQTAIKGEKQC